MLLDILTVYTLTGLVWCVWVELLNGKGWLARVGFILYFPMVAPTFLWEVIKEKWFKKS